MNNYKNIRLRDEKNIQSISLLYTLYFIPFLFLMLKSYAFDVDKNLAHTDDTIWIEVLEDTTWIPKEISQEEDAKLSEKGAYKEEHSKYRYLNNNIEEAMKNFRGEWVYVSSLLEAINKPNDIGKWPSRKKSVEAKCSAAPTSIITARGHPVEDLKETDRKIILKVLTSNEQEDFFNSMKERLGNYSLDDETLIETYLNNNFYAPCSDEKFLASIGKKRSDSMTDRKNAAFEAFVIHTKKVFESYYGAEFLKTRKIRIGFSDDTQKNIKWLDTFIRTEDTGLMRKYPEVLFRMYDTWVPLMPIKFAYKNDKEK